MENALHRHELLTGSILLVLSTLILVGIAQSKAWIVIGIGLSWWALVFIIDFLSRKFVHRTYLPDNEARKRRFLKMLIGGFAYSAIVDLVAVFFSRLWYYPLLPLPLYLLMTPGAFLVYAIILYELYMIFKRYLSRKEPALHFNKNLYSTVMGIELTLGIVGIIVSTAYILSFLSTLPISPLAITENSEVPVAGWFIFVFLTSIFFIFEYIAYREDKRTLTEDILGNDWWPLLAILLANIIAIILIEITNVPFGVWKFANWPFQEVQILGLPVMALAAWPLQFFAMFAILRVVFGKNEEHIW